MSYIRVPGDNLSRNPNELRSTIDQLHSAVVRLDAIKDKLAQMTDAAHIEAEYGLQPGEGDDVLNLVTSAANEIKAGAFYNQLIQRIS